MRMMGRNLRVFIGSTPILESTNCVINLNSNQESVDTKDNVKIFDKQATVSKSWSVQADSLKVDDLSTLLTAIKNSTLVEVMFDKTGGNNNTTMQGADYSRYGNAYITDLSISFNDREWSAKNLTLTGSGALNKFPHDNG